MKIVFSFIAFLVAAQAAPRDWMDVNDLQVAVRLMTPVDAIPHLPAGGEGRIVGGSEAVKGQIPFQVALNLDSKYLCGGSIISDSWVLTAAHCGTKSSTAVVTLGSVNRAASVEEGRVIVNSKRCIPHLDYNSYSLNYDIMLVELEKAVSFSDTIQPVKLAIDNTNTYSGSLARVSGFGRTYTGSSASSVLKYVDVKVITNEECTEVYRQIIYSGNICTVETEPLVPGNSCNGDSGGPLVDLESGLQIGIVSFGSSNGCESGDPKGLTRVTRFIDWISKNSGIKI